MKKTIQLLIAASLISTGALQARIWTSSDGAKTFNGDLKSYDEATGKVTVYKGLKQVSFDAAMLSEADQKWLKENKPEEKAVSSSTSTADAGKIGKKLQVEGVLSKLEDGKFVDYSMDNPAEYYVVYYSASW